MSNFAWIFVLTGLLTLLGCLTMLFITVKYYWGERGAPPPTGEMRKKMKEEELARRAKQIEYSRTHPIPPRDMSFFGKKDT